MQMTQRDPAKTMRKPSLRTRLLAVLRRITRRDWHWFDHPEMQARIQKAESDRIEGRVERYDSPESALARLDSLA